MMIKPSVAELLEKVDNRYESLVKTDDVAPDSIAADEIDAGKVKVC